MDLVALGDGQVEADERQRVGLGDAQRRVEAADEVRHLVEADELRGVGVVPKKEASIIGDLLRGTECFMFNDLNSVNAWRGIGIS